MISENKLKHSLGVARMCRELATKKGMSKDYCDAMFVMGFLHDIGYEDSPDTQHPLKSKELIDHFFMYTDEASDAIARHGKKFTNLTNADIILNTADLTISYDGKPIDMEGRLSGIAKRYGAESEHYRNAVHMVDALTQLTD